MSNNAIFRVGAACITAVTLALGLALPSTTADNSNLSIEVLPGSWVGTGTGFVGASPVTNQLWVRITKTNGLVGTGTQRWRSCKGRMKVCQQGSTRGAGWSKREPVSIALLTNGTIAGVDLYGIVSGYIQGDGSMEVVYNERVRDSGQDTTVAISYRLVRGPA